MFKYTYYCPRNVTLKLIRDIMRRTTTPIGTGSLEGNVSEPTISTSRDATGTTAFEHAIVESENGSECTIYPGGCGPEEIVTRWVTAKDGSFVSVADVR